MRTDKYLGRCIIYANRKLGNYTCAKKSSELNIAICHLILIKLQNINGHVDRRNNFTVNAITGD